MRRSSNPGRTPVSPIMWCSSPDCLRLPPVPPSLPPAGAAPLGSFGPPQGFEAVKPALKYSYKWQDGFLGAGDDVQPPAIATLREALARCDALARCRGITYEGTNSTTNATRVYFKTSSGVAHGEGWSTWVKVANVTPPARTIAVGGSSRLELRLRQDFYTVQNLSRVGDLWSFTRPLDTASVLPMCAHLGDLTIRLRGSDGGGEPGAWSYFSSIALGAPAVPLPATAIPPRGPKGELVLAAQDMTRLLASSSPGESSGGGGGFPLKVVRVYARSADGASLVVRFNLTSTATAHPIELGALGIALPESAGHPPDGIETVVWATPAAGDGRRRTLTATLAVTLPRSCGPTLTSATATALSSSCAWSTTRRRSS